MAWHVPATGEDVVAGAFDAFADPRIDQASGADGEGRAPGQHRQALVARGIEAVGLGEQVADRAREWRAQFGAQRATQLRVQVTDVEDAETIFSTLMGDVVEPRRDFIVSNALKVANLDV